MSMCIICLIVNHLTGGKDCQTCTRESATENQLEIICHIYLSIYLSTYLSIYPSIHPSIDPVKINSTCTRCDCIVTQHLLLSGQLSQSLDPRALQNVILYTSGITILFIHMYFNTVPQIVEEQHCFFQTLWKYKKYIVEINCASIQIVKQNHSKSIVLFKRLLKSQLYSVHERFVHCPALHCCSSSLLVDS